MDVNNLAIRENVTYGTFGTFLYGDTGFAATLLWQFYVYMFGSSTNKMGGFLGAFMDAHKRNFWKIMRSHRWC
jgi:hypothetical protein